MSLLKKSPAALRAHLLSLGLTLLALMTGCLPPHHEPTDPPVGQNCLALPVCADDEFEVERCEEGDESCYENEMCGVQIFCAADGELNCMAMPPCAPGEVEVDRCEEGDESCYESGICGETIFCAADGELNCMAMPTCAPDEIEVDRCEAGDESCYENEMCGVQIFCAPDHDVEQPL